MSIRYAIVFAAGLLFLSGCSAKRTVFPTRSLSAAEHMAQVRHHEEEAREHASTRGTASDAAEAPIECFDRPLAGIPTSGAEPLGIIRPCWTPVTNSSEIAAAILGRAHELIADKKR